ncbi:hypothetical protein DPMN_108269 [Dreissena polymorpha]|uniref:Uncharacterized protein n=1 Tax=Dreissena polymorpha TaxID=45954 RepID=A0A9D4K8F9_DREPO|nr:hypothetical protein DPMN_108269 [Dreissena polymorpha]
MSKLVVKNKFSHRPKKKTDKSKKETKDVEPADIECIMNGKSSAYEQPEDDNDKGDEYTWKDVVNFLDFFFYSVCYTSLLLDCHFSVSGLLKRQSF